MLSKIHLLFIVVLIGCYSTELAPINNVTCDFDDHINLNNFNLSAEIRKNLIFKRNLKYENDSVINETYKLSKTYSKSITNKRTNIRKVFIYSEKDGRLESYYYLRIGKKRYYNKEGEVIKVVNNKDEEHYPICFKKALSVFNKMKKQMEQFGYLRSRLNEMVG